MGRHGASHRASSGRRGRSRYGIVVALLVLVAATVGLGAWWWTLRSEVDPIAADPVSATAIVTSSAPCDDGGATTVRIVGAADDSSPTTLDGCGFAVGQRLAVQYLAGHPEKARLAGTTTAGGSSLASRIVPIAVLVAGLASVALVGLLLMRRHPSGDEDTPPAVTVEQLRERIGTSHQVGTSHQARPPAEPER